MKLFTVNLASIVQPSSFDVDDRYMTVQVDYTNINGDFEVIPLQSLNGVDFDPIQDLLGNPVVFKVRKESQSNVYASGSKTFNIDASLYTVAAKLRIQTTAGKFEATSGIVKMYVLQSDVTTTTEAPTTTAAATTTA